MSYTQTVKLQIVVTALMLTRFDRRGQALLGEKQGAQARGMHAEKTTSHSYAVIAQLVECQTSDLDVASSSLVYRSSEKTSLSMRSTAISRWQSDMCIQTDNDQRVFDERIGILAPSPKPLATATKRNLTGYSDEKVKISPLYELGKRGGSPLSQLQFKSNQLSSCRW